MTRKKSEGPLLYIYQPFSKNPSNQMQDVFTNRQENKELNEEKQRTKKNPHVVSTVEELLDEVEPIEITIAEKQVTPTAPNNKQRASFKKVKSFREMNVMERLKYLAEFPKSLPPVPCVFYTLNKNYQGYLHEFQNQEVTIQFHNQSTETIPVQELKDIIMIGIKK